ncbi:wax ester/triacylglycerol synthase family O-acyltransferase [Nocardia sp. SYP-A9097]|uniref:wax ester/triacylglycerol synthase family O-acyltransferase n=1 Tax=Nocardia sp. SYP-A9097 TaxID=2663237 RepID=UPI00129BA626|nr:wax ester/triacylglycerol synthase family O-acyltransferase [Nocardia sp. SYP-A9097]MRH87605.1 wax ester/triacylglycerol synthase family O-acyltransferase [Nocardia sp. SYP-A9097]
MTELHPLDAGFIELEDSDRHISLGIGAVAIISGTPPTRAEFAEVLGERIAANARLRQKMRRAPFDLTAPVWEEDPNFDLAHHIHWTALPEPADDSALFDFVAAELEKRLDRDHPLWQCIVVERLTGDRWALFVKAHHSMVDGVSGVTLLSTFCDGMEAVESGGANGAQPAVNWLAWAVKGIRLPFDLPRHAVSVIRGLIPLAAATLASATDSSLNGSIGQQRRYIAARTSLTEVREIGKAFGATVNDVVLAALASAYRDLLLQRGEQPAEDTVRILVPVSMRAADAKYVLDNRVSVMIPALPVHLEDPVQRLSLIHDLMTAHKSRGEAQAEKSVMGLADWLPFAPIAWTVRLLSLIPQHGITALATNIPGPPHALTVHGREVLSLLPAVPIAMRLRTGIAILSYHDQLNFGITGDYDTNPDLRTLADGIHGAIAELLTAARNLPDAL